MSHQDLPCIKNADTFLVGGDGVVGVALNKKPSNYTCLLKNRASGVRRKAAY